MVVSFTLVLITSFAAVLQIYGAFSDKEWCFHYAFLASLCSIIIGVIWILFNMRMSNPLSQAEIMVNLLFIGFGAIEMSVGIWAFVVYLKCLGQVQGFSAWKALGNIILLVPIFIAPFIIIYIIAKNLN